MRVIVVCAGGISTSMMSQAMNNYADPAWSIRAVMLSSLEKYIGEADILAIAPQIRYAEKNIRGLCEAHHIPYIMIDENVYGRMDGKAVIEQIQNAMPEDKEQEEQKPVRVLLLCGSGVSSYLLSGRIEKQAAEEGLSILCRASSAGRSGTDTQFNPDLILLAPQVNYQLSLFRKIYPRAAVFPLSKEIYGNLDIHGIVQFIREVLE